MGWSFFQASCYPFNFFQISRRFESLEKNSQNILRNVQCPRRSKPGILGGHGTNFGGCPLILRLALAAQDLLPTVVVVCLIPMASHTSPRRFEMSDMSKTF
jgi:hypothetical protein